MIPSPPSAPRPFRSRLRALLGRRRGGFTLVEVLVATTVFLIAMGAILFTFRMGILAWRVGHASSEMFQAARITQDVMLRDVNNLFYRTESDYNRTFRAQLDRIAGYNQSLEHASTIEDEEEARTFIRGLGLPPPDPEDLAPPIDLSFVGKDGGPTDTISFARRQPPRPESPADALGLIRIRYYVKDRTLWREESSVYGLRPGDELADILKNQSPELGAIAERFIRKRPGDSDDGGDPDEDDDFERTRARDDDRRGRARSRSRSREETNDLLPELPSIAEPLCEGVEVFDVAYRYYKFDQWNDVSEWDSGDWRYRFPEDEMDGPDEDEEGGSRIPRRPPPRMMGGILTGGAAATRTESGFGEGFGFQYVPRGTRRTAVVRGQPMPFNPRPDDLPGYLSIHVGIRDEKYGGKLQSFTFVVSIPMAQEDFDASMAEILPAGSGLPGALPGGVIPGAPGGPGIPGGGR